MFLLLLRAVLLHDSLLFDRNDNLFRSVAFVEFVIKRWLTLGQAGSLRRQVGLFDR